MSRLFSFRPLMLGLLAAGSMGLAACGSGSPPSSDASDAPPDITTRAELGCVAVAGPLDALQTPLSNTLASGLQRLPETVAIADELVTLVINTLDLVDSLAQAAGTLNPNATNPDTALLAPVLDQALCTTAAVGETVLSITLAATTPAADRLELNGLLDTVVALQATLQNALGQLSSGGTVPAVALLLQQVTNTLGNVLASPLGLTTLPGGQVLGAVLQPVSALLVELSGAMSALAGGDEQLFVQDLLGSVTNLVDTLAGNLGPLGVVLTTAVHALTPAIGLLETLLGTLLGNLI